MVLLDLPRLLGQLSLLVSEPEVSRFDRQRHSHQDTTDVEPKVPGPVKLHRWTDRQQDKRHHCVADGDLSGRPRDDIIDHFMGWRLEEVWPNVVPDRSGRQRDDDAGEEGEVVAWISSVPHGRQDEGGCCGVVGAALVTHPFEPVSRLDVPVVQENLEAGGKLDVEDPQVGDEVPARNSITVVAVEAEAGGVVDGVS